MKTLLRIAVVLAALSGAALLVSLRASRGDEPPREIALVARDMGFAFQTDSAGGPANPTLRLRPGEKVRLVVHNLDPGMRHDLAIEGFGVRTRTLAFGESAAVLISVPRGPGVHVYFCSFHARLMRGRIEVG